MAPPSPSTVHYLKAQTLLETAKRLYNPEDILLHIFKAWDESAKSASYDRNSWSNDQLRQQIAEFLIANYSKLLMAINAVYMDQAANASTDRGTQAVAKRAVAAFDRLLKAAVRGNHHTSVIEGFQKLRDAWAGAETGAGLGNASLSMDTREKLTVCENCGSTIGKLEMPHVWNDHVVCATCKRKLSTETA